MRPDEDYLSAYTSGTKGADMALKITRTNNAELIARKKELEQDLQNIAYASTEGAALTMRDVRDLASLGLLSREERALYDELRRIELLLRK